MSDVDEDLAEAEQLGDRPVIEKKPPINLPDVEGREVVAQLTQINGTSSRLDDPIHIGDRLYIVIEVEATAVNHKKTKEGLKRIPVLACDDLWPLDDDEGREIIARKRREALEAGRLEGQLKFDDIDPGDELVTDESGVVMTEAERAEAQGHTNGRGGYPPFLGYTDLSASELVERVRASDDRDLVLAIGTYEASGKNRSTVMDACVKRGAELVDLETAAR